MTERDEDEKNESKAGDSPVLNKDGIQSERAQKLGNQSLVEEAGDLELSQILSQESKAEINKNTTVIEPS